MTPIMGSRAGKSKAQAKVQAKAQTKTRAKMHAKKKPHPKTGLFLLASLLPGSNEVARRITSWCAEPAFP